MSERLSVWEVVVWWCGHRAPEYEELALSEQSARERAAELFTWGQKRFGEGWDVEVVAVQLDSVEVT